jgi:uncharacterized membrane protein
MRFLALLFFLATAPLVIFLAALSYGGVSTDIIKTELAKSGLYKKIDFPPVTPDYARAKVNKAIDDSALWITGKTNDAPIVSFKDIKDEFLAKNPDIQDSIVEMSNMPEAEASEGDYAQGEDPQEIMKSIAKNDFSYPLKDALSGLKMGHSVLSVMLPVLLILMIISVIVIILKSPDNKSRFRWLGVTFLLSAVGSYLLFLVFEFIAATALAAAIQNSNGIFTLVIPIIESVAMLFLARHGDFQIFYSFAIGVFGVVCLASSFAFQKDTIPNKPQPNQKKKST